MGGRGVDYQLYLANSRICWTSVGTLFANKQFSLTGQIMGTVNLTFRLLKVFLLVSFEAA